MLIQKAYKFRIYPTPEQATLINKTIGCTALYTIIFWRGGGMRSGRQAKA
ncbi:transposase [Paenibacillus forsythiae]|uniref:Transposase n=1 Tax=Paenibacillus forsythiae TaxID=365616 RepID=A0ABU3H8W0_9BACL|nr:transposase [Paenibacillus forsythiae]